MIVCEEFARVLRREENPDAAYMRHAARCRLCQYSIHLAIDHLLSGMRILDAGAFTRLVTDATRTCPSCNRVSDTWLRRAYPYRDENHIVCPGCNAAIKEQPAAE